MFPQGGPIPGQEQMPQPADAFQASQAPSFPPPPPNGQQGIPALPGGLGQPSFAGKAPKFSGEEGEKPAAKSLNMQA